MPTLTVKNGDKEIKLAFSGTPVLRDVLAEPQSAPGLEEYKKEFSIRWSEKSLGIKKNQ